MKIRLELFDRNNDADMNLLVEIVQANYPQTSYPFTQEKARNQHILFFKAFVGDEMIGVTGIEFRTPTLAETVKTVVLAKHRGKNYGKFLSQEVEDECKRRGIKKVMTTIYSTNHSMIAIKLKQGYTIEGFHPDHEAPGFHEYSLGKLIK